VEGCEMKNNNKSINEILSEISDDEKIEFEKKWEGMLKVWKKNSGKKVKSSLIMRFWKEIEELVWLGIGVGIFVIVFKFILLLGF
jgi:predicted SpoU family rRNA methylase